MYDQPCNRSRIFPVSINDENITALFSVMKQGKGCAPILQAYVAVWRAHGVHEKYHSTTCRRYKTSALPFLGIGLAVTVQEKAGWKPAALRIGEGVEWQSAYLYFVINFKISHAWKV